MLSEAITAEKIILPEVEPGSIFRANAADGQSVIGAVTMGAATDPVARWIFPEPAHYFGWFPRLIRAIAGRAISSGTAFCSPGFTGAAMWLTPEVHPDADAIIALIWDSMPDERQPEIFALLEQMSAFRPPEAHWYLPMIGVDTYKQGAGIGSALMTYSLEKIDAEDLPAYLESSDPKNISLYRRFGFEVVGEIRAGTSPTLFPMLRRARGLHLIK